MLLSVMWMELGQPSSGSNLSFLCSIAPSRWLHLVYKLRLILITRLILYLRLTWNYLKYFLEIRMKGFIPMMLCTYNYLCQCLMFFQFTTLQFKQLHIKLPQMIVHSPPREIMAWYSHCSLISTWWLRIQKLRKSIF